MDESKGRWVQEEETRIGLFWNMVGNVMRGVPSLKKNQKKSINTA